jgi:hypothetical protein
MSRKFKLIIIISCLLCIVAIAIVIFNTAQKDQNTSGDNITKQLSEKETDISRPAASSAQSNISDNTSSDSIINIPADILAQLPAAVAAKIKKDGFPSLPADMQAKILQLMRGTSAPQTPAKGSADGTNLAPTGEKYKDLIPLTDLKNGIYKGYEGGLYAGGNNKPSPEYLKIGMDSAARIRPLDSEGKPDDKGIIGLLTVGFSNTTMESQAFIKISNADPQRNPRVHVVDGAVGGRDAIELSNPAMTRYWDELKGRLDQAKVTPAQVQVIWLKEVVAGDTLPFPQDAERFRDALTNIINTLRNKFPNLHIIYVSSRIYGGYALRNGSQEPWAYEGGFAYKWMIEDWEKGPTPGNPWVAWGPYLWANGITSRSDGLAWNLSDYREDDQMHPGSAATAKVASYLSDFFKTDSTAKSWYLK